MLQIGDHVEVLTANGVADWMPGDVGIITCVNDSSTWRYDVCIPRIDPSITDWLFRAEHLRKIEKGDTVMFTFGDLVSATLDGDTVDGIIISKGVDMDGDWKVAYTRGGDHSDWGYFKPNRVVERSAPVSVDMPDLDDLRSGKIMAIKALRDATQWGLKDTKDVVEAIMGINQNTIDDLRNDLLIARERANDLDRKLRDLYATLDKDMLIALLIK